MTGGLSRAQLVSGVVAIAAEERSLRDVLRRSAALVVRATAADACFLHVVDEDGSVVLMGAEPAEFDALAGSIRLAPGEGLAGWVAHHAEMAVVSDKWSDPRYRYIPALRGEDYRSLVSVPLLRPNRGVVGVINVHAREAGHFAPEQVERVGEVADLLAGIVEGAVLHDRLRQKEQQLERFAEHSVELQEIEHRRIAGDIHDGISQRLVSAWYHLRAARSLAGEAAEIQDELDSVEQLISAAVEEARAAIAGLRPTVLDDLGLAAAIDSLATNAGPFEAEVDLEDCSLPPHLEMCVYRVTQEALQNAVKHSGARTVRITLRRHAEEVVLSVSDDGAGFEAQPRGRSGGYGVGGMAERAALIGGTLEVVSAPGEGTVVRMTVPLAGQPTHS